MNFRIEGIYLHELVLYYFLINATIIFLINLFSRRNIEANKWFHLFFLAFILNFADLQFTEDLYRGYDWYNVNAIPIRFTFGPLYWMFAKRLMDSSFKVKRQQYLYLIPVVLDVLYTMIRALYVGSLDAPDKAYFEYIQLEFLIREGLTIAYILFFLFATYQIIVIYHENLKKHYSNIDRLEVTWLQWTTVGLTLVWIIWAGFYIREWMVYPDSLSISTYLPLYLVLITLLLIMGYRSTMQMDLDLEIQANNQRAKFNDSSKTKYESYNMDQARIDKICSQIEQLMQKEKLYQNSKLTLSDLSHRLDISNAVISQAINRGFSTNFYDYINHYRVEDVKVMLLDKTNIKYTVIYLAHRAGFHSKSTFNTAFKKFTGKSPSAYRNISRKDNISKS